MTHQQPEASEDTGISININRRNLLLGGTILAAAASAGAVTPGAALAAAARMVPPSSRFLRLMLMEMPVSSDASGC